MTMHLVHPSLSTTGKKRSKQKFRNAEEARKARELEASWKDLEKKWGVSASTSQKKPEPLKYSLSTPEDRSTRHIKSLGTGVGVATMNPPKIYSGDKIKGIGTMHKSNAVPIFSDEQAVDIAKMRR